MPPGALFLALALFALGPLLWAGQSGSGGAGTQPVTGVVIEKIAPRSELEKAGFREGDLLLRWTRAGESGVLESPVELLNMEEEQKPLGTVRVEGIREGHSQAWDLGPGVWAPTARADLHGPVLAAYRQGEELWSAGRQADAIECWRQVATEVQPASRKAAAWVLYHAAESAAREKRWKEAQGLFAEAVQLAPPDPAFVARIHWRRAETYRLAKDWAPAVESYDLALKEMGKLSAERLMAASIVQDQGILCQDRGDPGCAKAYSNKALQMREHLAPGTLAVVRSLNALAGLALRADDLPEFERLMVRVLAIRERVVPGSVEVASTYNNLGMIAEKNGDLAKAGDYLQKALAMKEKLAPGTQELANAYNNLAIVANDRGDLDKAENYHHQALAIETKLDPNSMDVVASLINLGTVYEERHDFARAEASYNQARSIINAQDPGNEYMINIVHNMGNMFLAKGELDKAAGYLADAVRRKEKAAPDTLTLAASVAALGEVEYRQGKFQAADGHYQRALEMFKKVAPHNLGFGDLLNKRAEIAFDRGETAKAEESYRRALALWETNAPGSQGQAESLIGMARIVRQPDPAAALPWFERAIGALESQAARFGGGDEVRIGFRANHAGYYADYIDLLVQEGNPEMALEVSDKARARTLLEMLVSQHVEVRNGADPVLWERERTLRSEISAKSGRRVLLLGDKQNEKVLKEVEKSIADLLGQYENVETQIRVASPRYAALTRPQPLSAKQIRQQLLDADTALLEYSLGEERSYAFAVTQEAVVAVALPPRGEIEKAARNLYAQLTQSGGNAAPGGGADAGRKLNQAALELSRLVLQPVAPQLTRKRLLIVPDGALHYVPFGVLPAPAAAGAARESATHRPLIFDHEIVSLPSASVLAELRRAQTVRRPGEKQIAVLADPVFDKQDSRVNRKAGVPQRSTEYEAEDADALEKVTRSASDLGLLREGRPNLPRLRYSRQEALAILALTPRKQALAAMDFQATRAMAMSGELARYHIVHLATHGFIDSLHPEASGLVFSLVDPEGRTLRGFLSLEDIYNLDLPVDLVVLSACETGLGKEISGEGLVGLTRGFMYAGASRVIASLWKVSDLATAEFMKTFYQAMYARKLGPAAALREAQLKMAAHPRWSSPYYWAAFGVHGEWR